MVLHITGPNQMTNCVLATISKISLGHLLHQILILLRTHGTVSNENCTSDGQMKRKDLIVKLSCCKLWRRSGRGWSRPGLIHGLRACLTKLRLVLQQMGATLSGSSLSIVYIATCILFLFPMCSGWWRLNFGILRGGDRKCQDL